MRAPVLMFRFDYTGRELLTPFCMTIALDTIRV